jgi:hypothetical protein
VLFFTIVTANKNSISQIIKLGEPMNTNAVLVPTHNRSSRILKFLDAIVKNSLISDIYLGIDKTDPHLSEYNKIVGKLPKPNCVKIMETQSNSMLQSLNLMGSELSKDYQFLTFMGDDHIVKTRGWDVELVKPISKKFGISYPNDLLQQENLPTAVMINSRIVELLGFFGHPIFSHLYVDNSWLEIGKSLNNYNYFSNIIIEHEHYSAGKSKNDFTYMKNNSDEDYKKGLEEFNLYMKKYHKKIIMKIKFF